MPAGLPVRPWRDPARARIVAPVTRRLERRPGEPAWGGARGAAPACARHAPGPRPAARRGERRRGPRARRSRADAVHQAAAARARPEPAARGAAPARRRRAGGRHLADPAEAGLPRSSRSTGTLSMPEVSTRSAATSRPPPTRRRSRSRAASRDRRQHPLQAHQARPRRPAHRVRGASIANMLPKPPTSVTIGASKTSLTVRIAEAELKTAKDGVHGSVKADEEGAEAEVKKGRRQGGRLRQVGRQLVRRQDRGRGREVRRQGRAQGRQLEVVGRARLPARRATRSTSCPTWAASSSGAHDALTDSLGHLRGGGR